MRANDMENRRYIYDALYGIIYLPNFVWKVISCTELQHLREVRLCDINSLCLTGGSNINRYEHAIGACYLANNCVENWPQRNPISEKEKQQVVLAALFHDVVNPAFGHSVEHVVYKEGFRHENSFEDLVFGRKTKYYRYKSARFEPIYFGAHMELASKINEENLRAIAKIIRGEGKLGPLINGTMDLDNIDNVFRLAYHIGIVKSGKVPLNLARSLWVENGSLIIKETAISGVEEWYNVRKKLYSFLLLNPEEFSGKCMLREAVELAKKKYLHAFNWYDTDFALLRKLFEMPLVRQEVKRYLFSLNDELVDDLNNSIPSERLLRIFKQKKLKFSDKAYVEPTENGWKIHDKSKCFFVKHRKKELHVYKLIETGIQISRIIQRLMKGELYGYIGIFSTPNIEKSEIFTNINERRNLEDELTTMIRNTFKYARFKSATIALHPIVDVNKTKRQINFRTDRGRSLSIGTSSRRLLIGVFFGNPNLNMHRINPTSKIMKKIRKEIKFFLSDYMSDTEIKEVELYAESRQGK